MKNKYKLFRTIFFVIIGELITIIVIIALFFSPLMAFNYSKIDIIGTNRFFDDNGLKTMLNKKIQGLPILRINFSKLTQELKEIKGVNSIQVYPNFPNSLKLIIDPSIPVASSNLNSKIFIYDQNANVISNEECKECFQLEGLDINSDKKKNLRKTLYTLHSFSKAYSPKRILSVGADNYQTYRLTYSDIEIFLGTLDKLKQKLTNAFRVYNNGELFNKDIIDVRDPNNPILKNHI